MVLNKQKLTHSIEGLIIRKYLDLGQKKKEVSEDGHAQVCFLVILLNKGKEDTFTPAHQSTIQTSSSHKVSATTRLIFLYVFLDRGRIRT